MNECGCPFRERLCAGLLCLAALMGMPLLVSAQPDFPPPPKARVTSVSGNQQALGMNLSIRRFETDASVAQVLAFYRRLWRDRVAETELPPWRLIGRLSGDHYYNVQVQPRSGSGAWGYLSVSDLPGQARDRNYGLPSATFPSLSGSRVLDVQVSEDPHQTARTLVLENRFSVQRNQVYYRDHFLGQGWKLQMDEAIGRQAQVLRFRRGGEQVTLSIHRDGDRTGIVANRVREKVLPW